MSADDSLQPHFFDQLTPSEQSEYEALRRALASPSCKSRRNKSNETFQEVLDQLRRFVGDSTTRGLVCGIVWLDRRIAINTHQLSLVSNRCKSSINGSFQSLGYGTIPSGADVSPEIERIFPFMKGQFGLLRQWTIRQRIDEVPQGQPAPPEEEISPAPDGSLLNDAYVASYLNDECTLAEMVQSLIRNRAKASTKAEPEPVAAFELDPYCFVPREEPDQAERFGFFEGPWL
jgi:hypothetical protein